MHVISRKKLKQFWENHADSEPALVRWHQLVRRTNFNNYADLRRAFPSADLVEGLVVFNISGNKYRLIAPIHFNRGKVYVRHVLTHSEYDQGKWKQ